MQMPYPAEIAPPFIQLIMRHRPGINAIFFLQRVLLSVYPMRIKFHFQQMIHRAIERERKPRHALGTQFVVDIKTARTLEEQINLRARQLPVLSPVIPRRSSIWFVVFGHTKSVLYSSFPRYARRSFVRRKRKHLTRPIAPCYYWNRFLAILPYYGITF